VEVSGGFSEIETSKELNLDEIVQEKIYPKKAQKKKFAKKLLPKKSSIMPLQQNPTKSKSLY
jgi:hypothetical protein